MLSQVIDTYLTSGFIFLLQRNSPSEKSCLLKSSSKGRTPKWSAGLAAHLPLLSAGCITMRKSPPFPTVSILVTP